MDLLDPAGGYHYSKRPPLKGIIDLQLQGHVIRQALGSGAEKFYY